MKNDIRLSYPLWMMAFIALLGIFAYGINSPTAEFINNESETSLSIQAEAFESLLVFGALFLYLILLTVFCLKIHQYNKIIRIRKSRCFRSDLRNIWKLTKG